MATRKRTRVAYGLTDPLPNLAPLPIVANRAPTANDQAELGTIWLNTVTDIVYILSSITTNLSNWTTAPTSPTTVANLTITGVGGLDVQNAGSTTTISSGTINLDNAGGLTTILGDLTIAGTTTIQGDLDLTSAALIDLTSTANLDPSILISTNGGVLETIQITSVQGTAVDTIDISATVGGITIESVGLVSDDAINISAVAGGVDIDGALQVNIASSEAAADAIVLEASNAAGGLQIRAGSAGILIGNEADTAVIDVGDIAPTASRTITVGGGTVVTAAVTDTIDIGPDGATTNANSIKTVNIGTGGVTLGENNVNIGTGNRTSGTHLVAISTGTGTKTVNLGNADGLTTVNIDAITLINDSINVNTSINTGTSTGAVAIGNAAAGAISVDTAAGISLDAATASNFTVTGAGADLTLSSVGGSVLVESTEDAALAIRLHANGGVTETIQLHADQGTAVNSIDLLSDAGGITLTSNLATADGINLNAIGGGLDLDAALQVNIDSAQAAAVDSVRIVASAADGGIDIDSGTSGLTIDSTGGVSIDAAAASNFTATGAFDVTLSSTAGSMIVSGGEAVIDAVQLRSTSGGVQVTAGALGATTGLNIVQGATNASVQVGTGAPAHSAPQGSLYLRVDGSSTSTRAYINTDGATGWTNIVTAA